MLYRIAITFVFILATAGMSQRTIYAQQPVMKTAAQSFFDSIDHRISYLERQIPILKQKRDVAYLNTQRELDHTLFVKSYEEFLVDEDLDKAKELVASRLKRSEFRKDQSSVSFYRNYEENIYTRIKQQRTHYQELFLKERNFKKEYESYTENGTVEAYRKAGRMVNLALKYARENNLEETIKQLEVYESFTNAKIFDIESDYDLAELTNNAKSFGKVYQPLLSSDSIGGIREAEKLLSHCRNFGKLTGSSLDGEFFRKQEMALTSALSDLLEKEGREKELSRYTNQSVVAQFDTLNPCGVFKWHDQIVVIDEFNPKSSTENVKKGEAIIHADKMLATYLEKNKLCESAGDLRFGYAFIIPYKSNAEHSSFFFNRTSEKWQFIACYTVVVSADYTMKISKFMPPLFFENEMNTASR